MRKLFRMLFLLGSSHGSSHGSSTVTAAQTNDYMYQTDRLDDCRERAINGDCMFKQRFMAANCETTCAAIDTTFEEPTTMMQACGDLDPDRLIALQQAHAHEGDSLISTDPFMNKKENFLNEIQEFIREANGTEKTPIYGELDFHATTEMFADAEWGFYSGEGEVNKHLMFSDDVKNGCRTRPLIFYDLGSGTGKVAGRAWARGWDARGVEFSRTRFDRACKVVSRLRETWKKKLISRLRGQLQLYRGSILTHDFTDADIVYSNSDSFSDGMMEVLSRIACRLRPGSIFVSSKQLPKSDQFFANIGMGNYRQADVLNGKQIILPVIMYRRNSNTVMECWNDEKKKIQWKQPVEECHLYL